MVDCQGDRSADCGGVPKDRLTPKRDRARSVDVATLLFSVHGRHAAPEPVLTRLAAYAIDRDGAAVTTVCLASALFDWCVFATSGWEPEAVTAYLLKAASLFERLS